MNETQMFPPTPEERLAAVRTHLADEVEKREKSAESAMHKLYEARQILETFDEAMKSRAGTGRALLDHVANVVNSGALDDDGVKVTASVSHGSTWVPLTGIDSMSDADLIKSYRRLLDLTTKRETCDKESLRAFDAHCEEMEHRGMDLDPASLTKRLREAKAATP